MAIANVLWDLKKETLKEKIVLLPLIVALALIWPILLLVFVGLYFYGEWKTRRELRDLQKTIDWIERTK